jgi:hypothetical protein
VDFAKARLQTLEDARHKDVEESRNFQSMLRRSQMDRELRETTVRYAKEKEKLEDDNKRLALTVDSLKQQNEELRFNLQKKEEDYFRLKLSAAQAKSPEKVLPTIQ